MGLLGRLFRPGATTTVDGRSSGPARNRTGPVDRLRRPAPFVVPPTWVQLPTLAGGDSVEVVGESHYQENLDRVAGGRTHDGAAVKVVTAQLAREPDNPWDENAVRVDIGPSTVGYIGRDLAGDFHDVIAELAAGGRPATCRATITGGWDRGGGDRGSYGVILDVDLEFPGPETVILPAGRQVSILGEEHTQGVLAEILGGHPAAETVAVIGDPAITHLEVLIGGIRVGRLSPAMSERYRAWVKEVCAAGFEPTCHAVIAPGPKKIEASLLLARP